MEGPKNAILIMHTLVSLLWIGYASLWNWLLDQDSSNSKLFITTKVQLYQYDLG